MSTFQIQGILRPVVDRLALRGLKGMCSTMEIVKIVLTVIQVIAALFLIAVVLLQSGKSAGLSGAIAGGADTFLSKNKARSWDVRLTK